MRYNRNPVRDAAAKRTFNTLTRSSRVLVSGEKRMPCVLLQFSDRIATYAAQDFQSMLFELNGIPTGSARDYYSEVSNNNLTLTGSVVGWYTADNLRSYYGDSKGEIYATWAAYEAAQKADAAGMNWADFDNDGDGYVDTLWVVHSGFGAEESGSGSDIWSHSWDFYSAHYYYPSFPGVFVTSSPDPNRPGQYIKISSYIIQPEISRWSGGAGSETRIIGIGVFAHEFGHALGLPDLYDTRGSGAGAGLGNASLMAGGSWGGDGDDSRFPAHLDLWSKNDLGWVSPTPISTNGVWNLSEIEGGAASYKISDPSGSGSEYFLIENRQQTGFDATLFATGIFIYHIDQTVINNYRGSNAINQNTHAYGVALEEADAASDSYSAMHLFLNGGGRGQAGDSWPNGSKTFFTSASIPSTKTNGGSLQSMGISDISPKSSNMSFSTVGFDPAPATATPAVTTTPTATATETATRTNTQTPTATATSSFTATPAVPTPTVTSTISPTTVPDSTPTPAVVPTATPEAIPGGCAPFDFTGTLAQLQAFPDRALSLFSGDSRRLALSIGGEFRLPRSAVLRAAKKISAKVERSSRIREAIVKAVVSLQPFEGGSVVRCVSPLLPVQCQREDLMGKRGEYAVSTSEFTRSLAKAYATSFESILGSERRALAIYLRGSTGRKRVGRTFSTRVLREIRALSTACSLLPPDRVDCGNS